MCPQNLIFLPIGRDMAVFKYLALNINEYYTDMLEEYSQNGDSQTLKIRICVTMR